MGWDGVRYLGEKRTHATLYQRLFGPHENLVLEKFALRPNKLCFPSLTSLPLRSSPLFAVRFRKQSRDQFFRLNSNGARRSIICNRRGEGDGCLGPLKNPTVLFVIIASVKIPPLPS